MSASLMNTSEDLALLESARAGSDHAFDQLVRPHRTVLFAHAYRMLASTSDADDALQETLVRAWRHLRTFEARSSLRSWLLSIATRVCIDAIAQRKTRRLPSIDGVDPPANPQEIPAAPIFDSVWIEPCPDARLFDGPIDQRETPEATLTRRESVRLAFVAAVQWLPATQRAALLLHDVMGWQADEVADALDSSVAAVNSALQRARATVSAKTERRGGSAKYRDEDATRTAERYVLAWERGDASALASVLRDDVILAMPPVPTWFDGSAAVVAFFAGFIQSLRMRFRLVPASANNGAIALASYRATDPAATEFVADGLHMIELDARGAIENIVVFMGEQAVIAQGLARTIAA